MKAPSESAKTVYVVRRQTDDKSSRDRVSGILRYSGDHAHWDLRIITAPTSIATLPEIQERHPDGIICITMPETISLAALKVPVVTIDVTDIHPRHKSVNIDDQAIARLACELFARRKFAHLAYVGTNDKNHFPHSNAREDAIRAFAAETGATFQAFHIGLGPRNFSYTDRLSKDLHSLPLPCGILAFNDTSARILLDSARLANLKVPDQIAIIGIDNDTSICEFLRPTLTSILPDFEQSGFIAARLLDELMDRGKCDTKILRYGARALIERESTQDMRGSARIASLAQRVLHRDGMSGRKITSMANELNVSPRFLEMRFKSVFGRTMRSERTSLRLEKAKELLTTTNKPLYEIASACGSDRFASFAALFLRNVGMTMSAYRKSQPNLQRGQMTTSVPKRS